MKHSTERRMHEKAPGNGGFFVFEYGGKTRNKEF